MERALQCRHLTLRRLRPWLAAFWAFMLAAQPLSQAWPAGPPASGCARMAGLEVSGIDRGAVLDVHDLALGGVVATTTHGVSAATRTGTRVQLSNAQGLDVGLVLDLLDLPGR